MRSLKIFFPLLLLSLGWTTPVAAEPRAEQEFNITMLLYRGCEEACRGFQHYMKQNGLRANFTLLDAAQDRRKVTRFVREIQLARQKPDLVVTWGTSVTQEAIGHWKNDSERAIPRNIPVVFMVVSDPIAAGVIKDLQTGRPNLTGSLYLLPMDTQFQAARSYMDFKHVGYILNKSEANSVSTLADLKIEAERSGFSLNVAELPLSRAGKPDASRIPAIISNFRQEGVDLLYQGPDTFLNTRRDLVTDSALANNIPVFAAAEAPVQQSRALFGVVNRYWDVGRHTAEKAVQVLRDKTPPEEIPVTLPRKFSYLINLPVALQLKRYPPIKLLNIAEITGISQQEQ